jgi:hypothetical protein
MNKRVLPAFILLTLLSVSVVACGGADNPPDASTSPGAASTSPASTGRVSGGTTGEGKPDEPTRSAAGTGRGASSTSRTTEKRIAALATDPKHIPGAIVTGTGAVQTLPPSVEAQQEAMHNSYGSIKAFGSEAGTDETTEITAALQAYLSAKARGDWQVACSLLYSQLQERSQDLAEAPQEDEGCPTLLASLNSEVPTALLEKQSEIDVAEVRREGERAFVIFSSADSVSADMPMYFEDDGWKVGALEAYAL